MQPDVITRPVTPETPHLPSPPQDEELHAYFGPQHRWVLACVAASYTWTAVALLFFAVRDPALWIFLGVLGINLVGWATGLLDGVRNRRVTRTSHELIRRAWRPEHQPSVDVYLPTCGEPLDVLHNAYSHVSGLSWDGPLRVWVLDDADRAEVAELTADFGFDYVVRPDRGHLKKAGNLNHAFGLSAGEVVVVLDADFCPRPDLLSHLVPYLTDPRVAIVQSPQVFDTAPDMNWIQRAAGAAQEWFFRWLQPSRDANHATIRCGSNAVYRRSALAEIGGFARLDHSEDMFTGLALAERGYQTVYVPLQLAKGLSPDTLPAFVNQQYRWAMGNLHLLVSAEHPISSVPGRARLSYWNGIIGYVLASLNVIAAPLPPLVMMFCYPSDIRAWQVVALLGPLWVWLVLLPSVSRTRWRLEVIRAQLVIGMAAGAALLHTLRRRSAGWVPTGVGGGRSSLATRVMAVGFVWLAGMTVASWAGVVWDVRQYGWHEHWGIGLYALAFSYLTVPLLKDLALALTGRQPARRRAKPPDGGIGWPEGLMFTTALLGLGLLASGWVNPMLP